MVIKLLPLTLAVFIGFLVIGMQLPVLPLHLHDTLGMDTLVVGLVVGSQFAAALLSRSWAGNYADMRGAKRAVVAGSVAAAASGLLYLASLAFLDAPTTSVWILVAGRILLAMGESLIVTGAMGWGIGLVGPQNAGKVMAWNGIAMYGAYALGAPAGVVVNGLWGFNGISVATLFVPMLALAVVAGVRGISHQPAARAVLQGAERRLGARHGPGPVQRRLWRHHRLHRPAVRGQGLGQCLAGLHRVRRGLHRRPPVLRPSARQDRRRQGRAGVRDHRSGRPAADLGRGHGRHGLHRRRAHRLRLLAGLPRLRRGSRAPRAAADPQPGNGAYVAFLDMSLGITSPLAGLLADAGGIASVYLAGATAVALSVVVALKLLFGASKGNRHA